MLDFSHFVPFLLPLDWSSKCVLQRSLQHKLFFPFSFISWTWSLYRVFLTAKILNIQRVSSILLILSWTSRPCRICDCLVNLSQFVPFFSFAKLEDTVEFLWDISSHLVLSFFFVDLKEIAKFLKDRGKIARCFCQFIYFFLFFFDEYEVVEFLAHWISVVRQRFWLKAKMLDTGYFVHDSSCPLNLKTL